MSELVEFIRGCLDADEQTARAAVEESAPEWQYANHLGSWQVQTVRELGNPGYEYHAPITFDQEGLSDSVQPGAGAHIARHDPARVLADCEALRAVVAALIDAEDMIERIGPDLDKPGDAAEWANYHAWREAVELLAQPFAGRPGWDESWRMHGHKEAQA